MIHLDRPLLNGNSVLVGQVDLRTEWKTQIEASRRLERPTIKAPRSAGETAAWKRSSATVFMC